MCYRIWRALTVFGLLALSAMPLATVHADPPGNASFNRTWERTDYPVAESAVSRTWMWGPEAFTPLGQEPYTEAPGGWRNVQYFDKSRMEITDPAGDSDSPWFVTNGLLVVEMVSGDIQYGNASFGPNPGGRAQVNVAGDADDPTGPTYATFAGHLFDPARAPGDLIAQRINRVGTVTYDASLESYNVSAGFLDVVTDHTIAAPFWDFMNSTGLVWEDGTYTDDDLFLNPFYATGRPITEAYWANVKVAGSYQDVLTQCFERRCLTYTPGNDPNWQVEAGNVGRHYYIWRYGDYEDTPPPPGLSLYQSNYENWTEWPAVDDPTDDRIFGDTAGSAYRCADDYCVAIPGDTDTWTAVRGDLPVYDDISLFATVQLLHPVSGDRGCVMTHVVDTPTLLQLYAFCITGDDELIAFFYEESPEGPTSTWLIPPGTVDSFLPATEWNTLWISARGHDYWFFSNGVLVGQATHLEGPVRGFVALGAQRVAAGPAAVGATFDRLTIYDHQPRLP